MRIKAQPVTATLAILIFNAAWKDYIWPLLVINEDSMFAARKAWSSL